MSGTVLFERPGWLPRDIVIPVDKTTCAEVSSYCTKTYKEKRASIGFKLNARVKQKTTSKLETGDILVGGAAVVLGGAAGAAAGAGAAGVGAEVSAMVLTGEKGAEIGLIGGPPGLVAGMTAGALIGLFGWISYKAFTKKTYKIQIDKYTKKPAQFVRDPSPLNLRDQVQMREIETFAIVEPEDALGEDARQWYYLARLGRYCWIQRGQHDDPRKHRTAAKCAHFIASACRVNVDGEFQWPDD